MNQSEFLAIPCNLLKACVQDAIGFGFAYHWLRELSREFLTNHQAQQSQLRHYFRRSFEHCSNPSPKLQTTRSVTQTITMQKRACIFVSIFY